MSVVLDINTITNVVTAALILATISKLYRMDKRLSRIEWTLGIEGKRDE